MCISDTHEVPNWEQFVPPGDILIHAGDFSVKGKQAEVKAFQQRLLSFGHRHKLVVAGNHEISFDTAKIEQNRHRFAERFPFLQAENHRQIKALIADHPGITYLENSMVEIEGLRIWGSPYQCKYLDWAFQLTDKGLDSVWEGIPQGVDILVTHGPPKTVLDKCVTGKLVGSETLYAQVTKRVKPKLHVFGHVHEQHGTEERDGILFVNAAICDINYKASQMAVVVDCKLPEKTFTVVNK